MIENPPVVIATVGGAGTRLYPLTIIQPKSLVPILNYPILMRMLEILARQGCREFIIGSKGMENTTRLKEVFRYGEALSKKLDLTPGAKIRYQPKYDDIGNADAMRYCMQYYNINRDILVVSGDNIADARLEEIMKKHKEKDAILTIALKELGESEDISQYGVAELVEDGRIVRFVEKPKEKPPSRLINTSIYLFSPKIKEVFAEMGDKAKDIGKDVIPYLTEHGYLVYAHICKGYWADVGTPGAFLKTTQDILRRKVVNIKFRETDKYRETVWIHPTTLEKIKDKIERGEIQIGDYTFIGGDCDIGKGVKIESSCIGDNCIIDEGCQITGSAVMDFTNVEKNVRLNKCIVGRYSTIQRGSAIDAELPVEFGKIEDPTPVIGENVTIVENSIIGPKKRVAALADSHKVLSTGIFLELGYDKNNVYFVLK